MLRKQTVWLLTMLSLVIVLSAYYITLDRSKDHDFAHLNSGQANDEQSVQGENEEGLNDSLDPMDDSGATIDEITNISRDELFTTIRMELQNQRSKEKSRYEEIVASSSASIEEKNEALDQIQVLEQIDTKEAILQNRILAITDKYEDVLVRYDEDVIHVHVKTGELSADEANHIMQLVRDEFGEVQVAVGIE